MSDKPKTLYKDGKRLDGRKLDEIRDMEIKAGVIKEADGSARVRFGKTIVLVGVYGPRELHPKHLTLNDRALLRVKYDMLSFSVEDRKRPGPGRREREISKVLSEAFNSAVMTEEFPQTAIDVYLQVIQADASTRITGLNAISVALADAGIPMRGLVTGIAYGKIYDADGNKYMAADVFKPEDQWGDADIAYAKCMSTDETVLLQMDGDVTKEEFFEGKKMTDKILKKVHAAQLKAIKERYEE